MHDLPAQHAAERPCYRVHVREQHPGRCALGLHSGVFQGKEWYFEVPESALSVFFLYSSSQEALEAFWLLAVFKFVVLLLDRMALHRGHTPA